MTKRTGRDSSLINHTSCYKKNKTLFKHQVTKTRTNKIPEIHPNCAWVMNKVDEGAINIFERKILRGIFGAIKEAIIGKEGIDIGIDIY
jgi:hypothetical protein